MTTIVVGVDGSEHAKAALRWAVDEATRVGGATVVAVTSWQYPITPASPWMTGYEVPIDLSEPTTEMLRATIADVVSVPPAGVTVEQRVEVGPPAQVLLEAAKDADLLVVGTRGLGGFKGLLLGSVSHQIATHAPCTVVIVPSPGED
jgi:nucleotide-binding universal stress UspA family protein